jgi:prepilin-type N-terminal cleavage/methylation domain-containing protein
MNRLNRDSASGMTLIELLVAMSLLGVVSSLVLVGVQNATRVLAHNDDENRGLQDAKVILDRLSRDIRQARGVVCAEAAADPDAAVLVEFDHDDDSSTPVVLVHARCPDRAQLWVDDNSDYLEQSDEIVTWELADNADGIHYDVWRCAGDLDGQTCNGDAIGVESHLQASALVVRTLFYYLDSAGDPVEPEEANLVNLQMDYDAIVGRGVDEKQAAVSVRLRNKE